MFYKHLYVSLFMTYKSSLTTTPWSYSLLPSNGNIEITGAISDSLKIFKDFQEESTYVPKTPLIFFTA